MGGRPPDSAHEKTPDRFGPGSSSLYRIMHIILALAGAVTAIVMLTSETGRGILAGCLGLLVIGAVILSGLLLVLSL